MEKRIEIENGLLWFGGADCNVCQTLNPKVKAMIKAEFPKLDFIYIDVAQHPELAAQHQVFTVPVAIAIIEKRETHRWVRAFGIDEIRGKLKRPYSLLFED